MTVPFSFTGTLAFPPDAGQPNVNVPLAFSSQFDSADPGQILKLTGAGTKTLDLSTVPAAGVKYLLIKLDGGQGVVPVNVRFNGGGSSGQVEISPGGFVMIGSPAPTTGITAADVVYTSAATVRVWAFG